MSRKRPREEPLEFCSIKCKLQNVLRGGKTSPLLRTLQEEVLRAHEMMKLGTFFFKAFCLARKKVPHVDHSTAVACLQQVSTRSKSGAKGKATELNVEMGEFWKERFSAVYPKKVEAENRSRLRSEVADQMVQSLHTNAVTHFEMRCRRLCLSLGVKRQKTAKCVKNAFFGNWNDVSEKARESLQNIIPPDPAKGSTYYDMKKNPSRYVDATYRLCMEKMLCNGKMSEEEEQEEHEGDVKRRKRGERRDFCFAPLRSSCIPKHVKMDTETLAQIFVPYKEAMEARKAAPDRYHYNNWVWNGIIDRKKVDRKLRAGFRFHHEMHTDGVSVSLLFSRPKRESQSKGSGIKKAKLTRETTLAPAVAADLCSPVEILPSKKVGLDPGKRNVATMTDENGLSLRYTAKQRNFESKLVRFKAILKKEKEVSGVDLLETSLSEFSHRTNDEGAFWSYLKSKKWFDEGAREFYLRSTWRNWRLRIFSSRKSSEDRFLNRVASFYGPECEIFYGDWSRKNQMFGCDPSPVVGLRKALEKRFKVVDVDEYLTSKTCNRCYGRLESYAKRDGRRSHSRLSCSNCGRCLNRSKRFVDRDFNAASNILLVGISRVRPHFLERPKNRPVVGATGTSSDPMLDNKAKWSSAVAHVRQ